MKLVDPVRRVLGEELAHAGFFEVDRLAPFVRVLFRKVERRVFRDVAAVGTEVVVDDVEDHGQTLRMRGVDEATEVVGRAVEPRRRPKIDAVISPAEAAGEFVDRHHLDRVDAGVGEQRQFFHRRGERSFRCERADVNLRDDAIVDARRRVLPPECRRIDDHRFAVRPLRLRARCGIGVVAVGESKAIACTGARAVNQLREIAGRFAIERSRPIIDDNQNGAVCRRPNAKMHTVFPDFRAYRASALQGHQRDRVQSGRLAA